MRFCRPEGLILLGRIGFPRLTPWAKDLAPLKGLGEKTSDEQDRSDQSGKKNQIVNIKDEESRLRGMT